MDLRECVCIHPSTVSMLKLGKKTKSSDVLESIHFESFKFQVTRELPFSYKCFGRVLLSKEKRCYSVFPLTSCPLATRFYAISHRNRENKREG